MHRRRPSTGLLGPLGMSLIVALVVALAWSAPVAALAASPSKARTRAKPKSAPPAPDPGWVVDRARFESLQPDSHFDLAGTGSYRGAITVRPATSGNGVAAVDEVGLDDYLKGLAEVPATWPAEALKAQAIAARTYALNQLGAHELCATDACQVYAGLAKEEADVTGSWASAVAATTGQVVLYKGAPILAMYSSSNGGQTVAGSRPYLRSVADPDDVVSPLHRWQSAVSFATLTSVFVTPGPVVGIAKTGHDTFVLAWQAVDGTGTVNEQEVPTHDFIAQLNGTQPGQAGLPDLLPSSMFDLLVDPTTSRVTFVGRGFGHGIGMSQFGAMGKAARGMKAADILAAYYAGLRPVQIPAQSLPATIPVTVADQAGMVHVSSPGRFRVVDGSGQVLAAVASGDWQVTPAPGGKVHLVPPADQRGPLAVTPVAVVPSDPPLAAPATDASPVTASPVTAVVAGSAAPVALTFRLSVPALVRVTVQPPVGPAVVVAPQPFDAGEGRTSVLVPAASTGRLAEGSWTATIDADAGGGRATAVPVGFSIGQPPAPPDTAPGGRPSGGSGLPQLDLIAMGGVRQSPARRPGWALFLAALSLLASVGVVGRNAVRVVQARFDPTLR